MASVKIDSAGRMVPADHNQEIDSDFGASPSSSYMRSESDVVSVSGVVELLRNTWDVLTSFSIPSLHLSLPEKPQRMARAQTGKVEHSGRTRGRYMRRGRSHP